MQDLGSAEAKAAVLPDGRDLYIIKDLSEWTDQHSSERSLRRRYLPGSGSPSFAQTSGKTTKVLAEAAKEHSTYSTSVVIILAGEDSQVKKMEGCMSLTEPPKRCGDNPELWWLGTATIGSERREDGNSLETCDARELLDVKNHRLLADASAQDWLYEWTTSKDA